MFWVIILHTWICSENCLQEKMWHVISAETLHSCKSSGWAFSFSSLHHTNDSPRQQGPSHDKFSRRRFQIFCSSLCNSSQLLEVHIPCQKTPFGPYCRQFRTQVSRSIFLALLLHSMSSLAKNLQGKHYLIHCLTQTYCVFSYLVWKDAPFYRLRISKRALLDTITTCVI